MNIIKSIMQELGDGSFPVHVLPKEIQELIHDLNTTYKYPIDYIASSILGAISIAIGVNHVLKVKGSWEERCVFFIVLVGSPGTNKSHPLSFAMQPLSDIQKKQYETYKTSHKNYNALKKKNPEDKVETPFPSRIYVNNITIEKYIEIHSQNPLGIGIYTDEYASLLNTLAKYNKGGGSDTSTLLSIWSSKEILYDRKNTPDPILLSRPFTTIIGTSQPKIISKLMNVESRDNGFMDRVLLAYPNITKVLPIDFKDTDSNVENQWRGIISTAFELRNHKVKYSLSEDAQSTFTKYSSAISDMISSSDNDYIKGLLSKIQNYCLRFALLMQVIKNVLLLNQNGMESLQSCINISKDSVISAIEICDYFTMTGLKFREGISIISPIEALSEKQKRLYFQLGNTFSSKEAINSGKALDISTATVNRFLSKQQLFKRIERGKYTKVETHPE